MTLRTERLGRLRRPLLAAWRRGWLPAPAVSVCAQYRDGRRLSGRLDDRTQRSMLFGGYERFETEAVRSLLGPGDVFVDVGAHIGWFSVLAARRVTAEGVVYAFEPYPANVARLATNVGLNGLANVRIVAAPAAEVARCIWVAPQAASDSASVTGGPRRAGPGVLVPAVTLDSVLCDEDAIRLMKIDAEGLEPAVLRGASETLKRTTALMVEFNSSALRANGSDADDLLDQLAQGGFTQWRLLDGSPGKAPQPSRLPEFANLLFARDAATVGLELWR